MIKKYGIALFLLTITYNVYSMNVQESLSPALDRKCYLIVRYKRTYNSQQAAENFLSQNEKSDKATQLLQQYDKVYDQVQKKAQIFQEELLQKTIDGAYEEYCNLDSAVRYELAYRYKDTPFAMLINDGHGIVSKDIIGDMLATKASMGKMDHSVVCVQSYNSFEEDMLNAYVYGVGVLNPGSPQADVLEKGEVTTTPVENIRAIVSQSAYKDLTIEDLMNGMSKRPTLVLERHDETEWRSYDEREWRLITFFEDLNKKKTTIKMGLEFFLKTQSLRQLLEDICSGSTNGYSDVDKRHKITKDQQIQLKKFVAENNFTKDSLEWKALKKAQIGIKLPETTILQNLKDLLLLAVPLGIANGAIPFLAYQQVNGKIAGAIGTAVCAGSGYIVGNNIFPLLDDWHSDKAALRDFFGKNNVRTIRAGSQFAVFAVLNFLVHALAEYCGSFSMHWRIAIQSSRILLFAYSLFSQRQNTFYADDNFFGKFRFANPLLRRNKYDRSYTLADVLDAED